MKIHKENIYWIAEKLKVSHQAVYNWYNGKGQPSVKNIVALSHLLDKPIEEILKSMSTGKKFPSKKKTK